MSVNYMESTILHEIEEYKQMKRGLSFWRAHKLAIAKERKAGFLKNLYQDI